MEPRPVDPVDYRVPMAMDGSISDFASAGRRSSLQSLNLNLNLNLNQAQPQIHPCDSQRGLVRPRFVMGGIFEVMEGRD